MKRFMLFFLAPVLLALNFSVAKAATPEVVQKHKQMIYPVVQVEAKNALGSGTVLWSRKDKNGVAETYVLTNYHVIGSAISVIEKYDFEKKKDYKVEKRETVRVNWFNYNDLSRYVGTTGRVAEIVAHSEQHDLALLKIRDKENTVPYVATVACRAAPLALFEETYAVGGGLGYPPFATSGEIGFLDLERNNVRYILSTSPIIYGNSGGALFHQRADGRYEFIGVPAAVAVTGGFFSSTPVTHMGWAISLESVAEFLDNNKLGKLIPECK